MSLHALDLAQCPALDRHSLKEGRWKGEREGGREDVRKEGRKEQFSHHLLRKSGFKFT